MNLNTFAKEIALKEGGKVNLSIAQIKEVLRIILTEFAKLPLIEVEAVVRRYRKKTRRY